MSHDDINRNCFGFFGGSDILACGNCYASKRCKAVLVSHGFDLTDELLTHFLGDLPDIPYRDTDRVSELLKQIQEPPESLSSGDDDLLAMMGD